MSATLQDWHNALETLGKRPKWVRGGIQALCPAHPDTDPSLSVNEEKGTILVHCFSSCEFDAIRDALGISKPSGPPPPIQRRPDPKPEPEPAEPRALPSGKPYWPPHIYTDAEGNRVLAVVRRDKGLDGAGGKTFSQYTPAGDDLWVPGGLKRNRPLFRLPRLSEQGRVLVVEGEKCVMACEKAWPTQIVTTWAGGSKAWQKTDWEPLRGRALSLMADADESSRTAMRQLAYYMDSELDCAIHVALPDGENGEDVADWLEDGVEPAAERVASMLQPYEPDEEDRTEPPADPPPPLDGDIVANPHYELLGLAGDGVAFRLSIGRIVVKSRESLFQPNTLGALARLSFWYRLADVDNLGAATARRIGDSLLLEADKMGQVDLARIVGRGAAKLTDGTLAWHLGDRIFVDGDEHPLGGHYDKDRKRPPGLRGHFFVAEPRIELGEAASDADMRKAAAAVMQYRWDTPDDGRRLLGWIVASLIGGALDWRPHMFFTAPSSTGKTWLVDHVVKSILGPHTRKIADATAAALARETSYSSLPLLFDEAEPSQPWVQDTYALLRIAAGGDGERLRADVTSSTDVLSQAPRFPALMSAVSVPAWQRADETRWTFARLGKEVDDWSTVEEAITTAMLKADAIRYRIIRQMPEIVANVQRMIRTFQGQGMDSREALASAALTAGWHAWGIDEKDVYSKVEKDQPQDAVECLTDILGLIVSLDGNRKRSAHRVLTDGDRDDTKLVADQLGLRLGEFEGVCGLAIRNEHRGMREALRHTQWANVTLRLKLAEIQGAVLSQGPVRFPSGNGRATLIPHKALEREEIAVEGEHPQTGLGG